MKWAKSPPSLVCIRGRRRVWWTAWQSWTQVENYSAIHNLPFASKANGYEGLDTELLINNDKGGQPYRPAEKLDGR